MKKFFDFIFSMQFAGTLLLVFAAAIGTATFIENDYGTDAAKATVYNAKWFEALLALTAVSLIGSVFKYKLYQRKRYSVLFFHLAFIVMLIGAALTRYVGYEGIMMIREGDSSNQIISSTPYMQVNVIKDGKSYYFYKEHLFTTRKKNTFSETFFLEDEKVSLDLINTTPAGDGTITLSLSIGYKGENKPLTIRGSAGMLSRPGDVTVGDAVFSVSYGAKIIELPFSLMLRDFQLERYPGSMSPSSFASEVTVIDRSKNMEMPYRIFMNNILDYGGYRFFQSSYDKDEKGTILSVNHDKWGTTVTYIGYFLLAAGLVFNFFSKNSRFRKLSRASGTLKEKTVAATILLLGMLLIPPAPAFSQHSFPADQAAYDPARIDKGHAGMFGELMVQDNNGRMKPINTLSSEILRKVYRKDKFNGLNGNQVILGMVSNPGYWQGVQMIKISDDQLKKELGVTGKYASFNDFIDGEEGIYKLSAPVNAAYNKKPVERSAYDKDVMKVDERVNVVYMVYTGEYLTIFPEPDHPDNKWHSPNQTHLNFDSVTAGFVMNILPVYYEEVLQAMQSGNWSAADENLGYIKAYQEKYGKQVMPSASKTRLEIIYNNVNIFKRLFPVYALLGLILLILLFIKMLKPGLNLKAAIYFFMVLIFAAFLLHSVGLAIRWYISGHAPWSNGYETMIYISWGTVLSGLLFSRTSRITLATTAILASVTLMVANLSWLDPEITNLVPVLKSYWLVIHVAIITASYSFLGVGALLGLLSLILISLQNRKNYSTLKNTIEELTNINEMNLIIGVFLVTIGTFLGAVWANESWGRYWGWDPKETWALVTVLVYSFIVHMRLIPGLNGVLAFNFAALIGFSSVLMTYFGVNYYLSGLHSYAAGDPVPVPTFVYYAIAIVALVSIAAFINHSRMETLDKPEKN